MPTTPGASILAGTELHPGPDPEALSELRLLTCAEAAQALGVSVNMLAIWRSRSRPGAPQGPTFHKIGPKAVRYSALSLARFLAQSARTSTHDDREV